MPEGLDIEYGMFREITITRKESGRSEAREVNKGPDHEGSYMSGSGGQSLLKG